MTPITLSQSEYDLVEDKRDVPYLEIIKGMNSEEIRAFDSFLINNVMHYNLLQAGWLGKLQWFLGRKLNRQPSIDDFFKDMKQQAIAERYRVFYVFKYPEMVQAVSVDHIPLNTTSN